MQSQPGLLTRGAQYPQSEDYHFKPLNEHVQVYQRPFRIVQDVVIDASPQAQAALKDVTSLTIKGVLNYQACDDKVCFTPQDGAAHLDGDPSTIGPRARQAVTSRRVFLHAALAGAASTIWSRSRLRRDSRRPPHASRHRL